MNNRNYHSINITDIHPELKNLDYTIFNYYNGLKISNRYYSANNFGIFVFMIEKINVILKSNILLIVFIKF